MQLGELFIVGFYGKTVPNWVEKFALHYGLGGIVLFDYSCQTKQFDNNIESPEQLKTLCGDIASLSSQPLVFIDQEGGKVRRLKENKGFCPLPSQKFFSTMEMEEKVSLLNAAYAEMNQLGIHYNFAPVIDVDYNSNNPNIGTIERSYSSEIKEVKANALLVSEVAKKCNVGLCLKHYPGIGGATVDSHLDFMDISEALVSEQETLFYDLAPKMYGNAMMISHALVRQWEKDIPITLSQGVIKRVRQHVPDTLLISDDMQMQGLQKSMNTQEATLQTIKAGMDMVCIGNNLINEESRMIGVAEYLMHAMDTGILDSREIEKSIARGRHRKAMLVKAN